ncbi:hypothetical protein EGQ24_07650, partial [bacterium]|nr:hypothetical protein [bacterium]
NLGKIFDKLQANHVNKLFDYYYNNTITWDVEYIVNNLKHVIKEGAVNIGVPVNKNLISNIGTNGTHYSEESVFQNQNLDEIDFDNFIDPPEINIDRKLVNFAYLNVMYLYILDKDNLPKMTYIKTMGEDNGKWLVSSGVNVGDRIITGGIQKVIQGRPVRIVERIEEQATQKKVSLFQRATNKVKRLIKGK